MTTWAAWPGLQAGQLCGYSAKIAATPGEAADESIRFHPVDSACRVALGRLVAEPWPASAAGLLAICLCLAVSSLSFACCLPSAAKCRKLSARLHLVVLMDAGTSDADLSQKSLRHFPD